MSTTHPEALIEELAQELENLSTKHCVAYALNRVVTYGWKIPPGATGQESDPDTMAKAVSASDAFDAMARTALLKAYQAGQLCAPTEQQRLPRFAPAPAEAQETLQPGDVRPIVIGGTLCEDGRWWCEALECYVDPEECDVLPMTPSAQAAPVVTALGEALMSAFVTSESSGPSQCRAYQLVAKFKTLDELDTAHSAAIKAIDAARAAQEGAA